jgi:5'-nucleotidase
VLGQAAINPTIVDLADETGRASVAVTIPTATPAGTLVLNVAVPQTGTSIDVPLTLTVPAITSVTAPTISGTAKVGRTLTATPGTWSVASPAIAYQWNRAGAPIEGATAATHTVVAADAGAAITVTVTASAPGTTPGVATSTALTVDRLSSIIRGSVDRVLVSHNSPVDYRVVVSGHGLVPTGDVVVRDGRKVLATVTLTPADNGRITVTLPKFSRGIHLLTATYAGDAQFVDSVSFPALLFVY